MSHWIFIVEMDLGPKKKFEGGGTDPFGIFAREARCAPARDSLPTLPMATPPARSPLAFWFFPFRPRRPRLSCSVDPRPHMLKKSSRECSRV